ncbi:MAG: hypothetical protein KatS3mg055_0742 [Chloroflexus sp.]|nr:MAG: hypothetical protein KatS3mg055_0742 [Chloroflexus sp.]
MRALSTLRRTVAGSQDRRRRAPTFHFIVCDPFEERDKLPVHLLLDAWFDRKSRSANLVRQPRQPLCGELSHKHRGELIALEIDAVL